VKLRVVRSLSVFFCVSLSTAIAGCSAMYARAGSYVVPDCGGALLSTQNIHTTELLHDRVRYFIGDRSVGYYVITEVGVDELNVVVLTTFGNKALALTQHGIDVEITDYLGNEAVPAPLNILRDIHRLHFLRTNLAAGGTEQDRAEIGGFDVTERIDGSRIVRRVIGPVEGDVANVSIGAEYSTVEREGCGYSALFVTLGPSPPGPPSL